MPVEFLTDEEAAAFGRFGGATSQAELDRAFFLDDVDRALIAKRRGAHNRLGFALQLTTVRSLGTFLADPLDVPTVVLEYLAEQLEVADPSCVKRYTERRATRFEHVDEIKGARPWTRPTVRSATASPPRTPRSASTTTAGCTWSGSRPSLTRRA